MDITTGLFLGAGLAAAVGFRVFVPFLLMGIAARFELIPLVEGMEWMGTTPALIAFGTATLLELGAYFIPWLDNALDTVTTPAAFLGGSVMMYSTVGDMDPLFQWATAIIAGGGTAGVVKGSTVTTRLASTATTGGIANPLLAGVETVGAISLSILAHRVHLLALLKI